MEVLCKFSEITVPAHETAEWWCHVTGANVRGISPEPWAHKPRPQSSSARSRASSPNMRPRTTSASPPRSLSECMNVLTHAKPNAENSEQEVWAACAGKADPYFSCHPPSAPVEVLVIGAPLNLPVAHTLARRDLKAVWPRSEGQVWLTPRVLRGPPPRARPLRSSRTRAKAEGCRPANGPRRAVRRLLRDLITTLPLLSPAEEQHNDTEAGAEMAPSVDASVSAQAVPPAPPPATRSVAVQAQSLTKRVDKGIMGSELHTKNVSADGAGEMRARTPDAWVGGARALRDSHVRLVLRQLRHIERLNRALDHAAPPLKDN